MVIRKCVRGIAFVVLMLSIVSYVMAAAPTINFNEPPTPTDGATVTVNYVNVSVTTGGTTGIVYLKWNGGINETMTGSGNNYFSNKTSLSDGTFTYIVYANDTTIENWTSTGTRTVHVNTVPAVPGEPHINSYSPSSSNPTSYLGVNQIFNVTANQTADFRWFFNGSGIQTNSGVTAGTLVNYENNSAPLGTHNITVVVNNTNGTDSQTWLWTVTNAPDTTPPANVTNLTLIGNGTTWLLFNWTNPSDPDFNRVMILKNGTWVINQSNTTNSYNLTNLNPGTTYLITVKTVDSSGNVNQTGADLVASTDPNTRIGSPVSVILQNSTVTFTTVTGPGNTVEASNSSKSLPSDYMAVGSYIDISTTASYTGTIEVRVKYNTPLPSGYSESDIRLYHWNDSTARWDNVTTSVDTTNDKVIGTVSSLSPFVPAVPTKPSISKVSPTDLNVQTIGSQSATFKAKSDQIVNITWKLDNVLVFDNGSMAANAESNYTNIVPTTGSHNVSVTATNITSGLSNTTYWNWTVRPKTYETGNRIWDASKEMSLTYTWNPMSFYAFYYDVDNNVGNESLKIILGAKDDRDIQENSLIYSTKPEDVSFKYKKWGSYRVIGFMAEKYFAAYTSGSANITSTPISTINSKQLHKILMDDDTNRAVYAGSTLTLSEGYVLKVKDVDITGGKIVLLSLLKDGNEVDTTAVSAGNTYVYSKRVGAVSDVPIIAVHIDTVFSGREANAAFLKGIFQLSESFTSINTGNRYGIMKITGASDTGITMVNENSLSLAPNSVNDIMGDLKFIVADNSSVLRFAPTVKKSGMYEVRGTIAQNDDKTFEWNPLNFEGFYYDIDEDVGSEKLSLTRSDRTINENALVYNSTPQSVSFQYKDFGSYNVIGFMADKYFAGYTSSSKVTGGSVFSTINNKQLHKVLTDDNTQRAVYAGSTLTLSEGYVLKVKDVDITGGKIVLMTLLKDGNEIDTTAIQAGNTYTYSKRVGVVSELPIIAAHIETVFAGREANAAFIKGIFQISENFNSVKTGDTFGIMKVSAVSDTKIEMKNTGTVSLSPNSVIDVMGNIKLRVADDSSLVRFYPYIMVNGSIAAANQLSIDAPSNPSVKDTITITVTAGGASVDGAAVSFDDASIGTTNSTGKIDYILTRSGMHNITATKLGYERASKTIQVAEWVDNRLSIETPAIIDQNVPVLIKVISNGTPIAGANVTFDNSGIGNTDISGILNYTFTVSGTHNLGASKLKYISVVKEISVRMPFSEYKALDINISPTVVFTNQETLIRANITNVGTKSDEKPVELILNGTVVDNRTVALAPGDVKEINFTRKEALPGNYTVEILGQKGLLEVREEPLNFLLIGGIATGFGAIIIYLLTAKNKITLELLKQKFNALLKSVKKSA